MKYPNFLKKESTIGVCATSDGAGDVLKINKYKQAIKFFKEEGYKLVISKNLYKSHFARSASDRDRALEFNEMICDKNIDMIFFATGGEFLVESLSYIDFDNIEKNIKLIAGFSDPTGILYPVTTLLDIATVYGNNFSSFGEVPLQKHQNDFLRLLMGDEMSFSSYEFYEAEYVPKITGLEPSILNKKVCWKFDKSNIKLEGRIIGGCLDIISTIAGTKYDGIKIFQEKYKDDGIIWYFDNCELSMEEVIRVLWKLNELDYFKYTKAVLFGRFGREYSNLGYDIKTMLDDSVLKKLHIPVIYDCCLSHKSPCLPVINGSYCEIEYKNNKAKIKYTLK